MKRISRVAYWGLVFASVLAFTSRAAAQVNPDLYAGLKWRNVGPFHGGRISSVTGVIGDAGVFYMGTPLGGIWKTTSAGVTWFPIFDQETSVDSIGAIQVAPSNPDIVYAGAGDPIGGSLGNGMWKSTDAGKTWQHIGLEDTVKIDSILVDPTDPNLVVVSALGDTTHDGGGVYRSTDGGKTWTNVLKPADYDGTRDLEYAYDDPSVMLADTQGTGGGFGGGGSRPRPKPKPPLVFKSTDEGQTWTEIKIPPFPGRVGVAIAMHTSGRRMYIVGNNIEDGSGLYRSDDGGSTWQHMAGKDTRISNGQGAYSSGVFVDSRTPDILYTVSTAMYRSTDGGVTFDAFKGAPGGEDYHKLWIDPTNGKRMVVGADQGASVTLDGGNTWSLWYTEPIGQVYHVTTDSQYPYRIVAAQQDTGAVMVASRSSWGQINFTDWSPVPSSEFGVITPDPKNPHIIYGVGYGAGGGGNGLVKINMSTGQWENVAPNFGADATNTAPVATSRRSSTSPSTRALSTLLTSVLWSRATAPIPGRPLAPTSPPPRAPQVACGTPVPPSPPQPQGQQPSLTPPPPSINEFSISAVKPGVVWTVSTNGQIYNTIDAGKHWDNFSNIADLPPHTNFNTIEAGDDVNTAYVAGRIGGERGPAAVSPPIRTRTCRSSGAPPTAARPGPASSTACLATSAPEAGSTFCASIPSSPACSSPAPRPPSMSASIMAITGSRCARICPAPPSAISTIHTDHHENDLVIGTYGRGFWVLDDITPLRQIAANAKPSAHPPSISSSRRRPFAPASTATGISPSPSKCPMRPICRTARSWITT